VQACASFTESHAAMTVSQNDAGVELALPWSCAARRLVHDLFGPRRIGVAGEGWLILVRHGEHRQQVLEGREIASSTAAEIASSTWR
jgi:hypothetical protein